MPVLMTGASRWSTTSRQSARAGNRRFARLSVARAHKKAPYKTEVLGETLRVLISPGRARADPERAAAHVQTRDAVERGLLHRGGSR